MSWSQTPQFSCIIYYKLTLQYLHKSLSTIKVKWPLKIRMEYCVVIGRNHVLFVAEESKLFYAGYSYIHYYMYDNTNTSQLNGGKTGVN